MNFTETKDESAEIRKFQQRTRLQETPRASHRNEAGRRACQGDINGDVIADSRDAIQLKEADYPIVYYIPRKDVKMERLSRTSHQTYCPFKGQASYYSFVNGPANAVWSYEEPYDEVRVIKEHLAFYPERVDSITTEAA